MVKWLPFSSKSQIQNGNSAFFSVKSCSYPVLLFAQMKVHLLLRVASFDINPRYFLTHTWEINGNTDSVFSHVISTHNSSVTGTHQLKLSKLTTVGALFLQIFCPCLHLLKPGFSQASTDKITTVRNITTVHTKTKPKSL